MLGRPWTIMSGDKNGRYVSQKYGKMSLLLMKKRTTIAISPVLKTITHVKLGLFLEFWFAEFDV